jgi:hypothetical protein
MSIPFDGSKEIVAPLAEDRSAIAPGDLESAALEPGIRQDVRPDPELRDDSALAAGSDIRQPEAAGAETTDTHDEEAVASREWDEQPRIPTQYTVERGAEPAAGTDGAATETEHIRSEDTRRVGELAMHRHSSADAAAEDAETAEREAAAIQRRTALAESRSRHPSAWGRRLGEAAVTEEITTDGDTDVAPREYVDDVDERGLGTDVVDDTGEQSEDIASHFGFRATALADRVARAAIDGDERGEKLARALLSAELVSLRSHFAAWEAGLQEPNTDRHYEATGIARDFNTLDRPHLPVILADQPDGAEAPAETDQNQEFFTWFNNLTDDQLVNVMQWSEARTEAVSDAILAQREVIQRNIREDFGYLISDELVPESAREALERGFEQTAEFGAVSSFESGFYHAAGLYYGEEMRLGVRREYAVEEADKYMRFSHWVFLHEALHGADFANDMGLTYFVSTDEEPLTWVNEATKEHLTVAAMNGQAYVVDPNKRTDVGTYADIRELLHLVLTGGEFEIELTELTAANFEKLGGEGTSRQELADRVRASYQDRYPDLPPGETIMHLIAKEHNAAPKPLKHEVIRGWIDKLYEWRGVKSSVEDEQPTELEALGIRVV